MTTLPHSQALPAQLLDGLLQSVADAVYLVDHRGRVRFANAAALAVLGYDGGHEDELLGAPSHATIHSHHPGGGIYPEDECPLLLPRATGRPVRVEDDWFVRRDGSMVPVAYSSAPVEAPEGRGAVVVFRDTTERRAAEAASRRETVQRARAEALQASRARIVAAADAERRRLGRDIHDGAQQRLMNVALGIQGGLSALARAPGGNGAAGGAGVADEVGEATARLLDALAEVRATIADLRELAAGIHPSILTNRGLGAAVESLTGRMPLPTRFEVPDRRYAPEVEAAAYFLIAESLANVAKHAGADSASVVVEEDGALLRVTVSDDGTGGATAAPGHGLQGLTDRVGAAGGRLTVTSPPGGGTRLEAELPLG
ncbi:PAS domain S-box protein [Conexibacter sp. CPCC 206217]|uniref:sensor histidine kinase n=1 Tax=Conexibacter sp. CPCC 206217 TaxID=3064574 RepID=UPI002724DF57|nr:PAS domain S-box protein [Conexibacter sp. CPCC 206217]MDO8212357.1 PAS domain S-box protein [Conexibacter sp. CPCC 206217]